MAGRTVPQAPATVCSQILRADAGAERRLCSWATKVFTASTHRLVRSFGSRAAFGTNIGETCSATTVVRGIGVSIAHNVSMATERKRTERRTHPYGRVQFDALGADLERRLRRIYGRDWPQGFDDMISRLARARVR